MEEPGDYSFLGNHRGKNEDYEEDYEEDCEADYDEDFDYEELPENLKAQEKELGGRKRSKTTALLLAVFLGHMGVDRFYLGYIGMGILKFLTYGGFGVLWLIDIFRIASGSLQPADGSGFSDKKSQKRLRSRRTPFWVLVLLCVVVVFGVTSVSKTTAEPITLEELRSQSHPKVADNEDDIKEYYKGITGVRYEHASDFKNEKTAVLTWHYTSVYGDNTTNDLVIDFSKLSAEDQAQLTFEKVLDIAIGFVPVEEILEYYAFDKAIYVEREDHVAYELYYKEIDEKEANRPSKFFQDHGFSIVIKEYCDGHFKVAIETSWYDIAYHIGGGAFPQTKVMKEDLAKHKDWSFSLEEYINGG